VSRSIPGRILSKAFAARGIAGIVKSDALPVTDGERLRVVFEKVRSPWRQGVWLKCDRGLRIDGTHHVSVNLWSDTAPAIVICTCLTGDGRLNVYNIWDAGEGRQSQAFTSGMRIEELDRGRRYCCNDIGFETDFDKLTFRIERV
jgi:hypothetical protein